MLIAIATGISTMTRVLNCRDSQSMPTPSSSPIRARYGHVAVAAADCHAGPVGCQPPAPSGSGRGQRSNAFDVLLEEPRGVGPDGDVEVRGAAPYAPPVRHGLARRQRATQLDVHGQRFRPDER